MAPIVIDVSRAEDERDVIHRVVQALAEGKVVALPTETVYGLAASALNDTAVNRLIAIKGRQEGHPFTLAIKSADEALDYVPGMPRLAERLARRCWPGPITLVLDDDHPESLVRQLPDSVQRALVPERTLGLRVPAHPLTEAVLKLVAGPLVLTSANRTGEADAVTAQDVMQQLGNQVDLIVDDGRSKYGQPSSVVQVGPNGIQVLRPGVLTEAVLKRLSNLIFLFVCTGNTCRSPMAELLMRQRVAEKLGCHRDELEDRGVLVASAGIAAMAGGRASREAVDVMRDRGLDLSQHESQPLSDRLVRFADFILTMTRGHRDALLAHWPEAQVRTHLLSPDGQDVSDPIGGPTEMYVRCADQIDAQVKHWVSELDFSDILGTTGGG